MLPEDDRYRTLNRPYCVMAFVGLGSVNALFLTRFDSLALVEWICLSLYIVGQTLLVVACWNLLVLPIVWFSRSPRWSWWLHGFFASVLVLLIIDYVLFTLIELHLIRWVKDAWSIQGFESLVRTIVWTNVPPWLIVGLALLTFFVAPLLGSVLYHRTARWSEAMPRARASVYLLGAVVIGVVTLLAEGAISLQHMRPTVFKDKYRILPVPTRVVAAPGEVLSIPIKVKPLRDPREVAAQLERIGALPRRRPTVFVFAIETLRADAITPDVAPNLYRFAQENTRVRDAYASGNYSVTAFHSLFTANHALYANIERARGDRLGSVPLRMFRRLGYDIHLLASWDFSLNEYAFGDERRLATTFVDSRALVSGGFTPAGQHETREEWHTQWRVLGESLTRLDQQVVELFREHRALRAERPQLVITYLGSTHWPYYWPEERKPRFAPYTDFFRGQFLYSLAERRRLMMNRYRNSVHYVDSLFGAMVDHLKRVGLYDDAIVVVLGDHGDEIYDHSRIGRGHLLNPEISIPLIFKFGREGRHSGVRLDGKIATTVSVLPTVLDQLGVEGDYGALFDGESLFRTSGEIGISWNEVAAAEKALVLFTRRYKAFFGIPREDPTTAQRLRLLEIRDSRDVLLPPIETGTQGYVEFLMRNFSSMFQATSPLPFVVDLTSAAGGFPM